MLMGIALAVRAMQRNSLRSALTILALLVGVAAVILVTGIATGARDVIGLRIESIGSNAIVIIPKTTAASGARGQARGRLTEEDAIAILREAGSIGAIAPTLNGRAAVVSGDHNVTTSIVGTTTAYLGIRKYTIARGELWTPTDELTKTKVCVLGQSVANQVFGDEDPVGRTVRIGGHPHRVLGILAPRGQLAGGGLDQDDVVLMPLGSMRLRIAHVPTGNVGYLLAQATSPRTADRASKQVEAILRQRHHVEGRDPDFTVISQKRLLEIQALVFDVLTAFLVCIAAISLVVGGIGVMNIMLVSVTERTREIGIRMAIGAREGDVRTQFLVEAGTLALLGGLLGVLVGVAGLAGLGAILGWSLQPSVGALVAGIATSTLTGVVFGFAPARWASRLDPIVALRHE